MSVKVQVRNLSSGTTDDSLRSHFEQIHGNHVTLNFAAARPTGGGGGGGGGPAGHQGGYSGGGYGGGH
ncbi:hypothetical protein FMUND_10753 [Fusarium mundagurra]|uniref:RRM domain-containing protein n=1 Tax=Fusarium mundagurra TaxID=1567541 RepID=A0A8H6D9A5_9HYPO|nr:hypothetical protein FMUND_10753 [Fusarium mundagurra]